MDKNKQKERVKTLSFLESIPSFSKGDRKSYTTHSI